MRAGVRILARRFALLLALFACTAWASPSNKWRLQVDGAAATTGTIVLRLAGGRSRHRRRGRHCRGTYEHAAPDLIRDAIGAQVGKQYETGVDDGEDVLAKRRSGQPDLAIT